MDNVEEAAMDIFLPVLESAMVYASHYCKATGRSIVTAQDLQYGWRYAARVTLGKKLGSFFPEIYDDEDEDEEQSSSWADEVEDADESEEPFVRYTGTEELYVKMNEIYDTWSEWVPETPAEQAIKNAIDSSDGRVFD